MFKLKKREVTEEGVKLRIEENRGLLLTRQTGRKIDSLFICFIRTLVGTGDLPTYSKLKLFMEMKVRSELRGRVLRNLLRIREVPDLRPGKQVS
jgi:hypothetical protein